MPTAAPNPGELSPFDRLCIEIERAWEERRDHDLPVRLAEEHPEHADGLLAFFDYLIRADLGATATPEQRERAAALLQDRLRGNGLGDVADAIAASRSGEEDDAVPAGAGDGADGGIPTQRPAATGGASTGAPRVVAPVEAPPGAVATCKDFSDYAGELGHTLSHIAHAWGLPVDTSHAFIRHGAELPPRAQRELARRGANGLRGVDREVALRVIGGTRASAPEHQRQRAASRSVAYGPARPFSYRQTLLDAPSSLDEAEKQFWLSLEGGDPGATGEDA